MSVLHQPSPQPRGFTLLEVLLVLVILGLTMGTAYSALSGILNTKSVIEDRRASRQVANSLLVRLSREIQMATPNIPLLPPQQDLDRRYNTRESMEGTHGTMPSGMPGDSLRFIALEAGQYFETSRHSSTSSISQLRYFLALPEDDSQYSQSADRDLYVLVREEIPYTRPFQNAYERKIVFPLAERVAALRFRFYDARTEEWLESWEPGKQLGLPSLVEFTLVIRSPAGRTESFTTAVPLKASR